jgi:non-ribosomal peptide synthetase-like protein
VPGYLLLIYLGSTYSGYWYLLGTPVAAVIFVVCFGLGTAAFKYLLMRSITPGLYSIRSWFYLRKWMVDRLMDNTLAMADAVYATLYLPPWLRLLGASIGRRAEVSTAAHITPNLLRIDDESFVADAACIGPARVFNNMLMLAPTQIGCRSFLGNAAFLPGGGALADRCLLGVLSVPPANPAEPGTDWLGSPAMFLPRRQQSECFPETLTFTPTRRLYAERLAIEFFRIVLPPTLWFATAALGIHVLLQLIQFGSLTLLAAISPLLYLALALTATLVVVGIKYLLIGTYRPLVRPLWSHFVRRTELVTGLYENVTAPMLLSTLTGTPFAAPILRLFGVKIGRRVWIETSYITEFDLVSIGDDSEIGMFASLQTHLFEDRVMKMSHVRIGRGCTVGARSIVLYDSVMEDGASLDALSLLMKGETLSAGSRWRGIPARRCG